MSELKAYEDSVTIKTIDAGRSESEMFNLLPILLRDKSGNTTPLYPQPEKDKYFKRRIERTYGRVVLENKYLKLELFPEVGGHIYSCSDKIRGREIFYRNEHIKFSTMGRGGGYAPLGMEINYPDAHAISSTVPRQYSFEKGNGFVAAHIAETDAVYKTYWRYSFILRENSSSIEQQVFFLNRTHTPAMVKYWGNARNECTDDVQFIFPEKYSYRHGGHEEVLSWPHVYGKDISHWKNLRETLGLYMGTEDYGFFGYYDYAKKLGVAHYADPYELPGKKYWSWGVSLMGKVRHEHLTGDGLHEGEFQSGLMIDQDEYYQLDPMQAVEWKEYWYPVYEIGEFKNVNDKYALNLELLESNGKKAKLKICVNSTEALSPEIQVNSEGKNLFSCKTDIKPEKPAVEILEIAIDGKESLNKLMLDVLDGAKSVSCPLANERLDDSAYLIAEPHKNAPSTAEEFYRDAIYREKFMLSDEAAELYKRSLELDGNFSPSLLRLALMDIKEMKHEDAAEKLHRVIDRNIDSGDAYFYLGYLYMIEENLYEAKKCFWKAVKNRQEDKGFFGLGEVSSVSGDYTGALEYFERSISHNTKNFKARTAKATCLRKLQEYDKAEKVLLSILEEENLYVFARYELFLLYKESNSDGAGKIKEDIRTQLRRYPFYNFNDVYMEAASEYFYLGAIEDITKLLQGLLEENEMDARLFYALGFAYGKSGNIEQAAEYCEKAAKAERKKIFPFTCFDKAVLDYAVKTHPDHAAGYYYLGTLMASKNHLNEALELYKKAEELGDDYYILFRNMAFVLKEIQSESDGLSNDMKVKLRRVGMEASAAQNSQEKLLACYEKALASGGNDDAGILEETVKLYNASNTPEKTIKILEEARSIMDTCACLGKHYINALIKVKNFEKALKFLEECDYSIYENVLWTEYQTVCIEMGKAAMAAKESDKAVKYFMKSFDTLKSHGSGGRTKGTLAMNRLFLGLAYEHAGKKDKAEKVWNEALLDNKEYYFEIASAYDTWLDRYYQGLCLKKLGRDEEALTYLDGVREFAKHNPGPIGTYLLKLAIDAKLKNVEKILDVDQDMQEVETSVEM